MLARIVLRILVLAAAMWLTAWIVPGVEVEGGVLTYLWVAVLFGVINAVLGTILQLIALPLTVLTLGLFALVVNAAIVGITAKVSSDLSVDGFWAAFFAAILISIFSAVLGVLVHDRGN